MPPGFPLVPTVHCDTPEPKSSVLSTALKTVRTAVAVPENELKRWRRTFEANAKLVNGEK
jgi:solute carrier family 25 aspartate/glutamate transporter 12/13